MSEIGRIIKQARDQARLTALDFAHGIFEDFIELHGDRNFRDDGAVVGGVGRLGNQAVTVIGIQKGKNLQDNLKRNFGQPHPEGYRKSGPVGVRVDSAMYPGYTIPPYYDSMIAKVIVHGENRFEALMKMQRALYELEIEGVSTNVDFQWDLISDPRVVAGDYDTAYLMEEFLPKFQDNN